MKTFTNPSSAVSEQWRQTFDQINEMNKRFTSMNQIPIEKAVVPAQEWFDLYAQLLKLAKASHVAPVEVVDDLTDAEIRTILLDHGYVIKEGLTDLKPYTYAAARAIEVKVREKSMHMHGFVAQEHPPLKESTSVPEKKSKTFAYSGRIIKLVEKDFPRICAGCVCMDKAYGCPDMRMSAIAAGMRDCVYFPDMVYKDVTPIMEEKPV